MHSVGDGILSEIVVTAYVRGVEVPQAMWHCSKLRDGKIVWWGVFRTEEEARQALGASD